MAEALTGSQASSLLSQYGIDPNQLYSSANINQTLVRPESAPDDLLGIKSQAEFDSGYTQTKNQLNTLQEGLNKYNSQTEAGIQSIGDWRVNAEAITGEQASYNEQRNLGTKNLLLEQNRLQTLLGEKALDVQNRVAIAEKNVDFVRSLKLQYSGAGINYADNMDTIEKKIVKFSEEQKKTAYKDELKAQLNALGKSTKGLSTNELEKKLKKYNKSVLEEAKRMSEIQYQTALAQLQNLKSGGGGTASERVGTAGANAQNALLSSKGSDGFVDPNIYVSQRADYMRSGGSSTDFDAQFGNLLSPQEQGSLGMSNAVSSQKAQQTATSAMRIVNNMLNSGSALGNAVGPISSKLPTLRGSSADFEQDFNSLKALLTLENMGVMKGVLSDKDIEMIKNASANLSLSQSEAGFKRELANIKSILESRLGGENDPLGLGF